MPLPTVNLDDRRFDDLIAQARQLIPQYCPEWTDHNTSDPGIALLEIFAWMTDLMLFRVNQVPEKMFIKFLDMIGMQLDPPRAAVAPVTFYLAAAPTEPLTISAATEVATVRTEVTEAIVFSTETDLTIYPPNLKAAFTGNALGENTFTIHDLERLGVLGHKIAVFSAEPVPGDAFYLCLEHNHGAHVLSLLMACEVAGGAGVDPKEPPFVWEVWQGSLNRWSTCTVEYDGTLAFNITGEVILRLPSMAEEEFFGERGYWLRCRITSEQNYAGYKVSPDIESLRVESRGGTVSGRHGVVVKQEVLGRSDGNPGQKFKLLNSPVLFLDSDEDVILSEVPGAAPHIWHSVADFADSSANDYHFQLDHQSGEVTFGPALLQPDGTVYRFGAVPEPGATLKVRRYLYGGGVIGNVPARALSVLKASIPYVARVINHAPALGGRNSQTLDDAVTRVPHVLRTRTRAVTADDYEYLAAQVDGVARSRCITPNVSSSAGQASFPGQIRALDVQPGQVSMVVLPRIEVPVGRIAPDQLVLSAELRASVQSHLDERRMVGTTLEVRPPQYAWVSVSALMRVPVGSSRELKAGVQRAALATLYRYLNPHTGSASGQGWPFGRPLYLSELYSLLRSVPDSDFVEDIQVFLSDPGHADSRESVGPQLLLPPQGLIVSDLHTVRVE
ncbi:putative baseplate assembly protein (plasmid) [Deinococcus psychrotolerans]|uniref:Putative baseplate assembly protein n=1 Tax=Deinococcus psychrotolerans TaxID=2489213 RepID=A0A3G8YRW7_9DEIO|nr:putative baseplate assembly protein [Deinococcus psychrotolerans]AZI44511.1 putative baseplate assembly protein [Deinococcus psychrotolerans]